MARGEHDLACRRAMRLPTDMLGRVSGGYLVRAWCELRAGRPAEALRLAEQEWTTNDAFEPAPVFGLEDEAKEVMGRALYSLGRYPEAVFHLAGSAAMGRKTATQFLEQHKHEVVVRAALEVFLGDPANDEALKTVVRRVVRPSDLQ